MTSIVPCGAAFSLCLHLCTFQLPEGMLLIKSLQLHLLDYTSVGVIEVRCAPQTNMYTQRLHQHGCSEVAFVTFSNESGQTFFSFFYYVFLYSNIECLAGLLLCSEANACVLQTAANRNCAVCCYGHNTI